MENKIINAKLGSFESNLWEYHFLVPKTISEYFTKGNNHRVVVTFNDELKNHCAIMSSQEGPFIMLNKGIVKQLKIKTGDLVKLEITNDNSEYGMPICEEFEAVIFGDELVFEYFQRLTPGKQRNLIHLANKIKNPNIKINRSMAIAEHLIEARGAIDFKYLNEKIKEFNQRTRIN